MRSPNVATVRKQDPHRCLEGQVRINGRARSAPCGAGAAADEPRGTQTFRGKAARCAAGAPGLQAICLKLGMPVMGLRWCPRGGFTNAQSELSEYLYLSLIAAALQACQCSDRAA